MPLSDEMLYFRSRKITPVENPHKNHNFLTLFFEIWALFMEIGLFTIHIMFIAIFWNDKFLKQKFPPCVFGTFIQHLSMNC